MKSVHLAAVLAAVVAPGIAADPQTSSPAADPRAPVPPVEYRSVFAGTPAGVEQGASDWRKANAEVGQFPRGHADIVKWEAQQGAGSARPGRAPAERDEDGSR